MSTVTRRLGVVLIVTALLSIVALAFARYLSSPSWIDALWVCAASSSLVVALVLALALSQLFPALWQLACACALGSASAATRWFMLNAIIARGQLHSQIDLLQIWLAAGSVVWGGIALFWAVGAVGDALENPDYGRRASLIRLLVAASAVSLSLYSLAPLWMLIGLRINIWTVLGLLGLALLAYVLDLGQRWISRWIGR